MEDSSPPNPAPDTSSQSDHSSQSNSIPQGDQFLYYPVRDDETSTNSSQNGQAADASAAIDVPLSYSQTPMPVFPYGNVMPSASTMQRTKRTQCKNACTNCQKACKKCDDNRPCQRCIRYGTTGTCIDSKRKERKKGIKRGPYKKRDGKGLATETEDDDPRRSSQGAPVPPPHLPYVGPVGYPPAIWGPIPPAAPGGKLEGTGYYQPVLALAPVGGHGGEGVSVSGGSELSHHFPVGFYPATVISYPGPFPPFSIPQPHGMAHGFHFAYPPPPGIFAHRLPPMMVPPMNGDQSSSSNPAGGTAKNGVNAASEGRAKRDTNTGSHVNGQTKAVDPPSNGTAEKKID
ncbi:hypothetical protein Clacol_006268 [Clathrus columnatus]|uniref:Zn(2)-C6 fungal-type domain-containing protein n=1 Tax=Clathrus columnatus TaxID=1419009 RepID=A0AAV5AH57_9AGAM|nr:hypothetical protein Clacol_006268 [Clathrus columnatus]